MAQDRTLGDVPGLDDLLPNSAILPASYTYTEVNPLGEVTADATLGDLTMGIGSGDPFAYNIGFLDEPQGGGGNGTEGGGGYVAVHDPMQSSYMPSYGGYDGSTPGVVAGPQAAETGQWDQEQLDNARTIAQVGHKVGASDRDIQIALMAAIVESGLKNVDYGDRDSLGLFQQRDAWGSREDRLTPAKAAEMFFLGGHDGQQGLLDVKDRDSRPMGEVAQDVQVSAYPDRYAQHESEAASLLGAVSSTETTGGHGDPYALTEVDGHTVDRMTAAALKAVQKVWGGPGFNIMQGSHSTSVAASGNTHAGGGVIDIAPADGDWVGLMTAMRKVGFAAWIRNMPGYGQAGSGAHIHAVLIGDESASPEALTQIQSYLNNDNGLGGSAPDDGPRQFINNRFVWGKPPQKDQGPTWRDQVTKLAKTYIGTPFQWGGKDYSGIDTETLLHNIYSQVGVDLPQMAHDLRGLAEPIDVSEARPGDLIGWRDPTEGLRYGIYLDNGRLVEAGGPGRVVQVNELGSALLNAFGIPIQQLIDNPPAHPLGRPAPGGTPTYPTPGGGTYTPSTPSSPGHVTTPATHSGGPSHSYTEPGAHVGGGSHADPHGPQQAGLGALNPNHPHAPMPGEPF